jgi:hypothetical protein
VNAAELAHIRGGPDTAAIHATERQPVPWKRIFSSPNMWYIAAGYFCFFYGSFFYLTWFPTYLLEYRHLSLKAVGVFAAAPLVTAMIGDIVGGTLTDRVYRRTGRLSFSRRVVSGPGRDDRRCDNRDHLSGRLEFLSRHGAGAGLGSSDGRWRSIEWDCDRCHEHVRSRGSVDFAAGLRDAGSARILDRAVLCHSGGARRWCLHLDFSDQSGKIGRGRAPVTDTRVMFNRAIGRSFW